jgi:hypothetical protein
MHILEVSTIFALTEHVFKADSTIFTHVSKKLTRKTVFIRQSCSTAAALLEKKAVAGTLKIIKTK